RAGRRVPIIPGMELRAGDQVVTGAGSRLLVKLADGSSVKLGENGQLRFAELSPTRELFKAALNVLEGAFRFTTDIVAKNRKRGARRGGRFSVTPATADEQNAALAIYDELRNAGYAAELWPVKQAEKLVYIVRIRQLPSRAEANALANQLRGKFGIMEPKVSG